MNKTVSIPLANIINKFDVRTAIDEDRVLQFVAAYEAEQKVPLPKLLKLDNEDDVYAYVDGRHRGQAQAYMNRTHIDAILVDPDLNNQPLELYGIALEANFGGAKPPTRQDIVHTITRMLEAGCDRGSIKDRLHFLPQGSLRAFIASALSTIQKRRITKALDDIGEGLGLEAAAKANKVKVDTLRDVVRGKKGKWGKNRSEETTMAVELKNHISRSLRSTNTSISKKIEDMLRHVEDGDVSPMVAKDVIEAWDKHIRHTHLRIKDWYARLDAVSGEVSKSTLAD